jgi:hypothetical protein
MIHLHDDDFLEYLAVDDQADPKGKFALHLAACDSCQRGLVDAARFHARFAITSPVSIAKATNHSCWIQELYPFSANRMQVRLIEAIGVSVRITADSPMEQGVWVRVRLPDLDVIGEVLSSERGASGFQIEIRFDAGTGVQ